jgi:hypothetical protein
MTRISSGGPSAILLDKSSVAQCLDRSLKGSLHFPLSWIFSPHVTQTQVEQVQERRFQ